MNSDYNEEYLNNFNFTENVKCEECLFHKAGKCLHNVAPVKLCRFWTGENGRRPCRIEEMRIVIGTLTAYCKPIEAYIDTNTRKISISMDNGKILDTYNEATKVEVLDATEEQYITKDWKSYVKGSPYPKYDTPCAKCRYYNSNDGECTNPKTKELPKDMKEGCCNWANYRRVKYPVICSDPEDHNKIIYIDTFKQEIYDLFYQGKPVGVMTAFSVNSDLYTLKFRCKVTKDMKSYFEKCHDFYKPKQHIVDWERHKDSSLSEVTKIWSKLTKPKKVKTVLQEDMSSWKLRDKLASIITEKELEAIIKGWNKAVEEARQADDELYLPRLLSDTKSLFEEVNSNEEVIDIEKGWTLNTVTYKSKFGKYYKYAYEGNWNWRKSYEFEEVEPVEELEISTVYEPLIKRKSNKK